MIKRIVTSREKEKAQKNTATGCLLIIIIFIMVIIIGGCVGSKSKDNGSVVPETSSTESAKPKESKSKESSKSTEDFKMTQKTGWEKEVKKISAKNITATEKYNAVVKLSGKNYVRQDTSDFFAEMVTDYTTGKYLSNPKNDVYMLSQIYKAECLNKQGEVVMDARSATESLEAMYGFSFDYFQNTKYVYRGVETKNSESVISNEQQMDKALAKIISEQ